MKLSEVIQSGVASLCTGCGCSKKPLTAKTNASRESRTQGWWSPSFQSCFYPRCFTKIMRTISLYLRFRGVRLINCLDGFLSLVSDSQSITHRQLVLDTFKSAGLAINESKSHLHDFTPPDPHRFCHWLGFWFLWSAAREMGEFATADHSSIVKTEGASAPAFANCWPP